MSTPMASSITRRLATLALIGATSAVVTVTGAPSAQAAVSCSQVVFDDKLDAAIQTCEVIGDPVDVTYTFNCGAFVGDRVKMKRWTVSETALIPNQCSGRPWGIKSTR